ncbi:uncharacterized protein PGTG_17121 [Puccinia graminis f. sp. tritici CRL 75-36-700-3]|uniref:Uncharacterized protein n=1 Tax=Puccinia graminis f. sp. tritici (strain CRL 75-36-700-3 / race SCCL) TaxID=418459 RepID=E3L3Y9_PUCGT|nr:uncharacterized protein PGTG_17121 [Puccinia graminis f. sp. tritici CRL 75-36-700-3]EFP91264.1 hypothetical protein PGTG_17121 [Puccinia graminis f. sp. tritici CRL 75-36-700-3]
MSLVNPEWYQTNTACVNCQKIVEWCVYMYYNGVRVLVIRTPPGFVALDSVTATNITTKINKILISIDAKVDSHQIEINGIAQLPSKDLKIYTTQWLGSPIEK